MIVSVLALVLTTAGFGLHCADGQVFTALVASGASQKPEGHFG
jgi:hypothetical protein